MTPRRYSLWTWGPLGGFVIRELFATRTPAIRAFRKRADAVRSCWISGSRGAVVLYRPDGSRLFWEVRGLLPPTSRPELPAARSKRVPVVDVGTVQTTEWPHVIPGTAVGVA